MSRFMTAFLLIALAAIVFAVAREISHRRALKRLTHELEAAVARIAEQSGRQTVDEMVSGLAQELKTPLQELLGNTELMLAESAPTEELRQIREGAERAADIVRKLVAVAETGSLACRWQDVNDMIGRAIMGCQAELQARGVSIDRAPIERLPLVYVDGRQLEKVIATFIGRPARAAEAAGAPTRPDRPFTVKIGVSLLPLPDDRVIITIADDAPTTDEEQAFGAGGLTAARQVVQAHGGTLTVIARPGADTQTKINLPISSVCAQPQEPSSTWTESSISSTSIATGISTS